MVDWPLVALRKVSRSFKTADGPPVHALKDVDLDIHEGEFVAIVGPSGGGKSTLLNILGLLDVPSSGSYYLGGDDVTSRDGLDAARIRSSKIGFVFQAFHLLERRPAVDSVELGTMYQGIDRRRRRERSERALESVGLGGKLAQSVSTLSGGQRQRVAIARAVATQAKLILADEPTGNLDSVNAARVLDELERINNDGATVVVVTHSSDVAERASRTIKIVDGRIQSDSHRAMAAGEDGSVGSSYVIEGRPPTIGLEAHSSRGHASAAGLKIIDAWRDAWASVMSRPGHTVGQAVAVAIAVAMMVTTLGLATSAGAQVSSTFDSHLNREVSARWSGGLAHSPAFGDIAPRSEAIAGVDAAAAVVDIGAREVSYLSSGRVVQPHLVSGDIESAARLTIAKPDWHLGSLKSGEAYIGDLLANDLGIGDIARAPAIEVAGKRYTVAGVITQSSRLPLLRGEVLISETATTDISSASDVYALLLTQAGAAPQVARQLPVAINPFLPESLVITAPTDAKQLRGQIESGVQATLIAFTLVALLVAVAALVNATLLALSSRRGEIGMRKALGARDRDIGLLVTVESVYVGVLGGVGGLFLGMSAILVATIIQRWTPVFDVWLLPCSLILGVVVGAVGGALASIRASRLRPAENLRS